ncbi:uncharacterized protein LOC113319668 [Papaver somniferum]|uniref:uncharacterized protein LOC113319668 n=1 Tax=Papaver somniferum TaxID=3469 RepID=UPI000E6F6C4B|nr:uncharacterized protein LOC113319668 [Papaver somniferum]
MLMETGNLSSFPITNSENRSSNMSSALLNYLFPAPFVKSHGVDNIILVNPQMIRNSILSYDDPFEMFNGYIIDIPASTLSAVPVNLRTEMVKSSPSNSQVFLEQ